MQRIGKLLAVSAAITSVIAATPAFAQSIVPTATTGTGTVSGAVLGINMLAAPSVQAGATNAPLALLQLDARGSAQNVQVGSIPLMVSSSGVSPTDFTACSLQNTNNLGPALNSGTYAVSSLGPSSTLFSLNTPVVVPAGGMIDLALVCNTSALAPIGSTLQIAVQPAAVQATTVGGGQVTVRAGVEQNGATGPTSGTVTVVSPTASSGTGSTTSNSGPGVPNTGAGGNAANTIALLFAAAAVALGGTYMFALRRARA